MDGMTGESGGKCPVMHGASAAVGQVVSDDSIANRRSSIVGGRSNRDWWPNQLDLSILHQHSSLSNPMGTGFDYSAAFRTLDLAAV